MINQIENKRRLKENRALRVRKSLKGTSQKPRLCVVKTNAHIQVQLIDDDAGHTLASVSTLSKELRNTQFGRKNKESAKRLGELIAERAKEKNIKVVVFDRGPFRYHGVLASLADAARAGGLEF